MSTDAMVTVYTHSPRIGLTLNHATIALAMQRILAMYKLSTIWYHNVAPTNLVINSHLKGKEWVPFSVILCDNDHMGRYIVAVQDDSGTRALSGRSPDGQYWQIETQPINADILPLIDEYVDRLLAEPLTTDTIIRNVSYALKARELVKGYLG